MSTQQILCDIKQRLATAQHILITGQGNPDGDSIGAELALYDILAQHARQTGQQWEIILANDELPPASYYFFPNIQQRVTPVEQILTRRFDAAFILDASRERIGKTLPLVQQCPTTINIDHHRSRPDHVETIAWIEPEKSSVAEMIYDFFEHPDWPVTLTPDIATCLYAAIIYDTGAFRYPSTTPCTHRIAAKLMETGIDAAHIVEQMFLDKPVSALHLLTAVLNTLQWDATGAILWGTMTRDICNAVHAQPGDDDGLIANYAFTQGVKVAALFKEVSATEVRVSFRSRGFLDLGKFARSMHPQGGGHPRAAGCKMTGNIREVQTKVVHALQQALRNAT